MCHMDEFELNSRFHDGDREAFAELVRIHQAVIAGVCGRRLFYDKHLAEDAVQTTLLNAWKGCGTFDPTQSFRSWVITIAHHTVDTILRRPRRESTNSLDGDDAGESFYSQMLVDKGYEPDQKSILHELIKIVKEIFKLLRDDYQKILLLRFYRGLSPSEIAVEMNATAGVVKNRLRQAQKQLHSHIKISYPDYAKYVRSDGI